MRKKFAYIYFILICIIVLGVFIAVKLNYDRLEVFHEVPKDNYRDYIKYKIEYKETRGDYIFIKGWLVENVMDNLYFNKNYLLKDSKGKIYKLKTAKFERIDITAQFNDGFNYDNSGMIGMAKTSKLEKGEKYEIGFVLTGLDKFEIIFFTNDFVTIDKK